MSPLVSVVIPTYNRSAFLVEAVESVLAQTWEDLEIVVVDDGSTDSTQECVRKYKDKVRYLRKENGGPASARNVGVRLARGVYVSFLDSDDQCYPERIELQTDYLESHPEFAMVYSARSWMDADGQPLGVSSDGRHHLPAGEIFLDLFRANYVGSASAVQLRKCCFEKVGFFSESCVPCEDYDLWLRIASEYRIGSLNVPLFRYRLHESGLHQNLRRRYSGYMTTLTNALRLDYWAKVDEKTKRKAVRRRFYEAYVSFGYGFFERRDLEMARHLFAKAVVIEPWHMKSAAYALATCFPARCIESLRELKQRLAPENTATDEKPFHRLGQQANRLR